ncbi:hypothetical protein JCM16418A_03870 [Paenibacillus pini]
MLQLQTYFNYSKIGTFLIFIPTWVLTIVWMNHIMCLNILTSYTMISYEEDEV